MKSIFSKASSILKGVGFILLVVFLGVAPTPVSAQLETNTFSFKGSPERMVVPDCVSAVTIKARGADGGNSEEETGGEGQTIEATFDVSPGDILEIVVGESGFGEGIVTSGGGGGSGVRNVTTNELLIIAGGGGGSGAITNSGIGEGGNMVSNSPSASCGFDLPGCGGSIIFAPIVDDTGGGAGGGGYIGDGEGDGIATRGFGGKGGFGAVGGLGEAGSLNFRGGYGVGGGGGGIVECTGGGGGGGYTGGTGGSKDESSGNGGGRGGSGFVKFNVQYLETPGANGASTNRAGEVQISYNMDTPPAVSASSTLGNDEILLNATLSSSIATSWQWTGPNGFTSTLEGPTINPAVAGTYTVLVTDENGCTATASTNVVITVPELEERVQNIPTMSEWGLIIYGLLVLNLSLWWLRNFQQIPKPAAPSK